MSGNVIIVTRNVRIGIVGSEAAKFTQAGEVMARHIIEGLLTADQVTEVVSGGCHLGGIDRWAVEIGRERGLRVTEFLPKTRAWIGGYRERNLQIVDSSDVVHCITVNALPPGYSGMRFGLCYHCGTTEHVKSGGCWTARQARLVGKPGIVHVVNQEKL